MGYPLKKQSSTTSEVELEAHPNVSSKKKYLALGLLSFSSGLPVPLLSATLQAWLVSESISLVQIGLLSAVTLPYGLRFLWAPFVDRYYFPKIGARRSWLVFSQVGLIISLGVLAHLNPKDNLNLFFAIALVVGLLGATQDTAADALRAEVLTEKERGPGSSVSVIGSRLAFFVSGAVALILADHFSWKAIYLFMAGLVSIGITGSLISPNPQSHQLSTENLRDSIRKPFLEFFERKDALFITATIVLYKVGFSMANSMSVPFFLSQGFTKTDIGSINKVLGLVFTLAGASAGGLMIKRFGSLKTLFGFGWLQLSASLVFAMVALFPKSLFNLVICVSFDNFCGGLATAALFAFILSKAEKSFIATQMGIMGSLLALTRTISSMPTGWIVEQWGWACFFIVTAILGVPALLLLKRVTPKVAIPLDRA
ncbi:MAG: MFS transporter [Proteobacteria bacterium]|nr:MFS transporter [Pseudomonadota bacterium]